MPPSLTARWTDVLLPGNVPNAEDKIVQRAIVQAVQPLLDPRFDKLSFGYRPGLGREHALATAKLLTVQQGHGTWITEDLQDAFTKVPHGRLLDVLRKAELPEDLLRLIMRVVHNPQRRGIPQGGCLSPLLLNAYLDFHVDRTWRRKHPKTPLIRVADDLLILCQDTLQAQQAYSDLDRLIEPIGMRLKHGPQKAVRQLREGEQAQWLGYQISLSQDSQDIAVRIGEPCWDKLTEKLCLLHEAPQAALRASDVVYGWVGQLGPCLEYVRPEEVYARIVSVGRIAGFEEVPPWDDLLRHWEQAQARFTSLETDTRLMVSTGFALAPPNGFVFLPA